MREICPKISWYALFGIIALMLGACIKPVGIEPFFEDERVQQMIGGIGGTIKFVGIEYEHPDDKDNMPKLRLSSASRERDIDVLEEGHEISLGSGGHTAIVIVLTNFAIYDEGSIAWYYNGKEIISHNENNFLLVIAGDGDFKSSGRYQLTVTGKINGVLYSTHIILEVN
jgi:hypothetical protein